MKNVTIIILLHKIHSYKLLTYLILSIGFVTFFVIFQFCTPVPFFVATTTLQHVVVARVLLKCASPTRLARVFWSSFYTHSYTCRIFTT